MATRKRTRTRARSKSFKKSRKQPVGGRSRRGGNWFNPPIPGGSRGRGGGKRVEGAIMGGRRAVEGLLMGGSI